MRLVREQNTRAIARYPNAIKHRAQPAGTRAAIVDSHNLQSVDNGFFVVQYLDTCVFHRIEILAGIVEFLVVAGHKVDAERRLDFLPRSNNRLGIDLAAVIEVSGDEDNVRLKRLQLAYNTAHESGAVYVAEMQIADLYGDASLPRLGQIRQPDIDLLHANHAGIDHTANGYESCSSIQHIHNQRTPLWHTRKRKHSIDRPAQACRQKEKVQRSQPHRRERVEHTHKVIGVAIAEKTC